MEEVRITRNFSYRHRNIILSQEVPMSIGSAVIQEGIFIGANRQLYSTSYNNKLGLVGYGAGNLVAIYDPNRKDGKGVYGTLKKHTKEVTGVRFLERNDILISTGEDGEINIWKLQGESYVYKESLEFHEHSITCLTTVNEELLITGDASGFVAIWSLHEGSWNLLESFRVKSNFLPLSLAILSVERNSFILSVGGTNNNIYIYSFCISDFSSKIENFTLGAVLPGHEDWVKCLSFVEENPSKSYILASGSQDRYIRLWRINLNEFIDDSDEDKKKLILLSNKQYKFNISKGTRVAISFEALIVGHDDWVQSLQWNPKKSATSLEPGKLRLLSSSADSTLMISEMDEESGIWICTTRLGEISIKGASTATGASGGFWSCLWYLDYEENYNIITHGKTGSIRSYKSTDLEGKDYEAVLSITGAISDVTNVKWSLGGSYFYSTSLDQTTRLFAPWVAKEEDISWHEFARPQIHGYDMICIDNISPTKFVSSGDEKILRVFEVTKSISNLIMKFCNIDMTMSDNEAKLPDAASLPVLGLSNKANNEQLSAGEVAQRQEDEERNENTTQKQDDVLDGLVIPPTEDYLQRYTLFPELEKLYGHGYEISCCDVSPSGTLIASCCKSNNPKLAGIRIFNAKKEYQLYPEPLLGHNLTVTNLKFSPDGRYLLAVSRDRQFSLWSIDEDTEVFKLIEFNSKAHSRIVWDCSWAPVSKFGTYFFTASRDKSIKMWSQGDKVLNEATVKLSGPVTAISIFPSILNDSTVLLAAGLEDGSIYCFTIDLMSTEKKFCQTVAFNHQITPASRISSMDFSKELSNNYFKLAVGSHDNSVRLYYISST